MRKLLLLIAMIFLLTGCVNEVEQEKVTLPDATTENMSEHVTEQPTTKPATEKPTELFDEKLERDDTQSEITYSLNKINFSEKGIIGSYFIYENYIFYALDYRMYVIAGETGDEEDNICTAELFMLNTDTGERKLIHSLYDVDLSFHDIKYNGRYLLWSEVSNEEMSINVIDVENNTQELTLSGLERSMGDIKLFDDYIFWTDKESDAINYSVYRYDFDTKNTVELIKTDSMSGMFNIEPAQKIITVCSGKLSGDAVNTAVKGYNFEGKLLYNYDIDYEVIDAYCNSYGVVWRGGRDVFFYDAKSEKTYNMGRADTYVLISDYIIMNNGFEGVYSYKLRDAMQKCIIKNSEIYMVGLNVSANGDIFGKWKSATAPNGEETFIMLKASEVLK